MGDNAAQAPVLSLTLAQKEKTLQDLTHDHWLNCSADGMVALGVRTFLELWNVFKNYDVPICDVCNEAGIKVCFSSKPLLCRGFLSPFFEQFGVHYRPKHVEMKSVQCECMIIVSKRNSIVHELLLSLLKLLSTSVDIYLLLRNATDI